MSNDKTNSKINFASLFAGMAMVTIAAPGRSGGPKKATIQFSPKTGITSFSELTQEKLGPGVYNCYYNNEAKALALVKTGDSEKVKIKGFAGIHKLIGAKDNEKIITELEFEGVTEPYVSFGYVTTEVIAERERKKKEDDAPGELPSL